MMLKIEIKNSLFLLVVFILLTLQFINALDDMSELVLSNRWNIILYGYVFLFTGSFFCYLGLLGYGRLPWNIPWYGKNKVILFLGISLFSALCQNLSTLVYEYYIFYGEAGILKTQLQFSYFSYFIVLLLCSVFLFIPRKIGYIMCMQLPLYVIDMLSRSQDWLIFSARLRTLWNVLLMFVIVWPILCHSRAMLEHWNIRNRKQLWMCLCISIVIGFLIYYFRL